MGLDEFWWQVAFERIEPLEDGWVQSAKLINYLSSRIDSDEVLGLGDVYHHLNQPEKELEESEESIKASEAEFVLAASMFAKVLNAKVAKGEQSP